MATPTLDEIEARARLLEPGCGVQGTAFLSDLLLALVSHVRALEKRVSGAEGYRDEVDAFVLCDRARITALEEKVATREKEMDRLRVVLPQRDDAAYEQCARLFERLSALEAKVAALEPRAKEVKVRAAWKPVADEMDRLRAENAELREKLAKTAEALDNTRQTSFSTTQKLREENAELRKRIASQDVVRKMEQLLPPQWPAPQPIETAPLERILVVFEGGQMEVIRPVKLDTELGWREFLLQNKATHWWPPPPPPGGAK